MALQQPSPVLAQFTSASTAGDVYVELGFIPAYIYLVADVAGTNSNTYEWFDKTELTMIGTINSVLKNTGSTGVRTLVTTAGQVIERYAGGDVVAADEAATSDPKHVTVDGAVAVADHVTSAGVLIPKEMQVNSGVNILVAYRRG